MILFVPFGAVDEPITSVMVAHIYVNVLRWLLLWKFGPVGRNSQLIFLFMLLYFTEILPIIFPLKWFYICK